MWVVSVLPEAAHLRHEDVDDHRIEAVAFERGEAGGAAVGKHRLEAVPLQRQLDRQGYQRIVIDYQYTLHCGAPALK